MRLGRIEAMHTIFLGEVTDGWLNEEIHPLLWLPCTNISIAAGEFTYTNELRAACQDRSTILKSSANWGFSQGSVSGCMMGTGKMELLVHSRACQLCVILPPSLPHPRLPTTLCALQGSSFECSQGEVKSLPQITADISVILALHRKPTGCLIHTALYNSDPSSTLCPPLLQKESSMHRNFYCIYFPCVLFMYPHYFACSMERQRGSFK